MCFLLKIIRFLHIYYGCYALGWYCGKLRRNFTSLDDILELFVCQILWIDHELIDI